MLTHDARFAVSRMIYNTEIVFKEVNNLEDIETQQNEINTLVRLTTSPHVIRLYDLIVSDNPYHNRSATSSELIVKGFLLEHASRGNLRDLLTTNSLEIS